ncbi:MAG: chemotaxis-specific protein-glutamate methyltransferase CheB [Polyangiaceae bacterium]|nr:chemotaxis-specific protein-glutamate methyltransferase CheB [Polyangiaceae bacterium]
MTAARTNAPLRVLVVDDSAYNRRNIADILGENDEVEVIGKAADGEEALRLAIQQKPDVITLDLEMPRMDGFTFLRILMARQPTPVIVVSSYSQKENVFKALELGAIDFVAKPEQRYSFNGPIRREILQKVRLVRALRPLSFRPMPSAASAAPAAPARVDVTPRASQPQLRYVVAVAASTGGPPALMELLPRIPERSAAAILVAQHMPEKFTKTFAERLDKKSSVHVTEAMDNDPIARGRVYICPGRNCMESVVGVGGGVGVQADLRIRLVAPGRGDRYVPSANRLFRSVAEVAGSRAVGVILTGMGDDGADGARAILDAGGTVIAESEETAVVYGMPGAAVRAGVVSDVMPLSAIGDYLAGIL